MLETLDYTIRTVHRPFYISISIFLTYHVNSGTNQKQPMANSWMRMLDMEYLRGFVNALGVYASLNLSLLYLSQLFIWFYCICLLYLSHIHVNRTFLHKLKDKDNKTLKIKKRCIVTGEENRTYVPIDIQPLNVMQPLNIQHHATTSISNP